MNHHKSKTRFHESRAPKGDFADSYRSYLTPEEAEVEVDKLLGNNGLESKA